jgi:hypothetical protein
MLERCGKPTHPAYFLYGGRGITVSPELQTFEGFYAVLGPRPTGGSLDRVDVNGNYTRDNVRWSTAKTQTRNRQNNRWITYKGVRKTLAEWSEILKIPYDRLSARLLRYGWSTERALEMPRYERGDPRVESLSRHVPTERQPRAEVPDRDKRWTHGRTKTREYRAWAGMIDRCENTARPEYADYGGRGIKIAPELRAFEGFLAVLGPCAPGLSLDRINVNGDYAPGNVRWADAKTQARNRRTSRFIAHNGKTQTLKEWSIALAIPYPRLGFRIRSGWPVERAFAAPRYGWRDRKV